MQCSEYSVDIEYVRQAADLHGFSGKIPIHHPAAAAAATGINSNLEIASEHHPPTLHAYTSSYWPSLRSLKKAGCPELRSWAEGLYENTSRN